MFKNDHLSFSRVTRWEQCPLAFKFHYIDHAQAAPPGPERGFGKALHWVAEHLVRDVMEHELIGPLPLDRARHLWMEAWTRENLSGVALYQEGLELLARFIQRQGVIDHRDELGAEVEFHLPVGPFVLLGFIDRVQRVDDRTIRIVDYKSNRLLFSREEVETSLQMSIYQAAARQAWPWAERVELVFDMLRHDCCLSTERNAEQVAAALAYVEATGRQIETATNFPARPNANCVYCDYTEHCHAYGAALSGKREVVAKDMADLEQVAREREEVTRLAKVLYARKEKLEEVIKAHLNEQPELKVDGVRYTTFTTTRVEYPLDPTIKALADVVGLSRDALVDRIAVVNKDALEELLKEVGTKIPRPQLIMLRAQLDARAKRSPSSRLSAKAVHA